MSNQQQCAPVEPLGEACFELFLGPVIHRVAGLIQQQDGWLQQAGSRDCDRLTLTAGNTLTPLSHLHRKSTWVPVDELRHTRLLGSAQHRGIVSARSAKHDVVAN